MTWDTRPEDWGKPGHAELGSETEAILDQIEYLTDSAIPLSSYKTASENVNNSAVLQNDDVLLKAVEASSVYIVEAHLFYFSGTTPDLKIAWTVPAGATLVWGGVYYDAALAMTSNGNFATAANLAIGGSGGDAHASLFGLLTTSTAAGTLQMQWAQNTANLSNSTIYAGSYLTLRKIA